MSTSNESKFFLREFLKYIRTPCNCTWHGGSHSIVGNCGLLPASVKADFFSLQLFYHQAKTGLLFFFSEKKIKAEILFLRSCHFLSHLSVIFPPLSLPISRRNRNQVSFRVFQMTKTKNVVKGGRQTIPTLRIKVRFCKIDKEQLNKQQPEVIVEALQ